MGLFSSHVSLKVAGKGGNWALSLSLSEVQCYGNLPDRFESTGCQAIRDKMSHQLEHLLLQVQDYLEVLEKPYDEQPGQEKWRKSSPGGIRRGIEMLSCSS